MLVEPALFLVGRYPALSWVSAVMCRIKSSVVRAKANLQNAMRHCKRQYGGLLNYLACIADDTTDLGDLVSSFLTRDALPSGSAKTHSVEPSRSTRIRSQHRFSPVSDRKTGHFRPSQVDVQTS
ncbi:hypothetical protein [Luteibacter mycovicinus]|uniref:hypothetical protein n=1 Tax=Luteibacter mycovicinus TaxID=1500890 RepID=UPI00068D1DA2|nr:hypothetical protein [Luteibacter sp. 9143a]